MKRDVQVAAWLEAGRIARIDYHVTLTVAPEDRDVRLGAVVSDQGIAKIPGS